MTQLDADGRNDASFTGTHITMTNRQLQSYTRRLFIFNMNTAFFCSLLKANDEDESNESTLYTLPQSLISVDESWLKHTIHTIYVYDLRIFGLANITVEMRTNSLSNSFIIFLDYTYYIHSIGEEVKSTYEQSIWNRILKETWIAVNVYRI